MVVAAIALGGALGAVTRYLIAVRLADFLGVDIPYGTLTVNLVGSLLLGIVVALVEERGAFGPETRSFITIGFLGGMTTFSTFVYEGWEFTREGDMLKAGVYAAGSVICAFAAFTLGHALVRVLEA
jgi:fluoride exporter